MGGVRRCCSSCCSSAPAGPGSPQWPFANLALEARPCRSGLSASPTLLRHPRFVGRHEIRRESTENSAAFRIGRREPCKRPVHAPGPGRLPGATTGRGRCTVPRFVLCAPPRSCSPSPLEKVTTLSSYAQVSDFSSLILPVLMSPRVARPAACACFSKYQDSFEKLLIKERREENNHHWDWGVRT